MSIHNTGIRCPRGEEERRNLPIVSVRTGITTSLDAGFGYRRLHARHRTQLHRVRCAFGVQRAGQDVFNPAARSFGVT